MKQKVVLVVAILALAGGFSTALISTAAVAQEATPSACNPDEDPTKCDIEKQQEEAKKQCEGPDCCGAVKTSIIKGAFCEEKSGGGVIFGLLKEILKIMTAGVGVAAVGGIAWGALLYTTAESKPEQTKKAIGVITNVVIGIVAYALMAVLLNFLIPGGIFT